MAKISGVLTDGAGNIINNCTIELCAKKTTNRVLTQTQAFIVADDGKYEINALPCEYDVTLIINGFPPKKLGSIQIFSDSVDGTLNDYLLNPTEEEITPAILQQVFDARNEANRSANRAVESEKKIKTSENNAVEASNSAKNSADNAKSSADEASKTSTAVKNSTDDAKKYAKQSADEANNAKKSADSANQSATNAKNSAQQSADNSATSKTLADAAKKSADSAYKSATDAKNAALSIDTTIFIKKSGVDNQLIDGSLDVKNLTENGERVYSPNNKPTADDVGALPVVKTGTNVAPIYVVVGHLVCSDWIGKWDFMPNRHDELPFGWYFRNGDNYLLSSPQGQALNSLSTNYKNDHRITIKIINGLQYINVPTAFAPDGRGFFIRAVDGITRQVGHVEDDAIRNIWGELQHVMQWRGSVPYGVFSLNTSTGGSGLNNRYASVICHANDSDYPERPITFDTSRVVPTANENRVLNIGATPAIYLGV